MGKLFRETSTDGGAPPAQREPWPARKLMVATVLAACCCAAVAMGSAGVTSHVRGLKDPTDVGAVDAGIFDDDDDDETPGRRLAGGGSRPCHTFPKKSKCQRRDDRCKWTKKPGERGKCESSLPR